MKFNLGDNDLGDLGLGDFSLGDLGLGDFNLGDFNLGDFDLIPNKQSSTVNIQSTQRKNCGISLETCLKTTTLFLPETSKKQEESVKKALWSETALLIQRKCKKIASCGVRTHHFFCEP